MAEIGGILAGIVLFASALGFTYFLWVRYLQQYSTAQLLFGLSGAFFVITLSIYIFLLLVPSQQGIPAFILLAVFTGFSLALAGLGVYEHLNPPPEPQPLPPPPEPPKEEPKEEPLLPEKLRTEHHLILGGTGAGKTTVIQHLVSQDIENGATVIVIDGQGDLIRNLSNLKIDKERVVLIDPRSSVEHPLALNLFDMGRDRLRKYDPAERAAYRNNLIELLEFVIGSIMGSDFTAKMQVPFRYVIALMLEIPNATIFTLREIFTKQGFQKYAGYVSKLPPTGVEFFKHSFNDEAEYGETKKHILRRLDGVLLNDTISGMFAHPKSKIDMAEEINEGGKVILINTDVALLGDQGARLFGRFFVALIAQAIQERQSIHPKERGRVYLYLDEAYMYIDKNVTKLLETARKYELGVILAHQNLSQLGDAEEAVITNTSIKMVSGINASDARTLAPNYKRFLPKEGYVTMKAEDLLSIPPLTFLTFVKGQDPKTVTFDPRAFGKLPKRTDMPALRKLMRDKYSGKIEQPKKSDEGDGSKLFKT